MARVCCCPRQTTTISWRNLHDPVLEHKKAIKRRRVEASAGQFSQAERMVKCSHIRCQPGNAGDNVAIPIPAVDRGKGDPVVFLLNY